VDPRVFLPSCVTGAGGSRNAPLVSVGGRFAGRQPCAGERAAPTASARRFAWKSMSCPGVLCHGVQACSTRTLIHNYFLLNLQPFRRGMIPFGTLSPEHLLHFPMKWEQPLLLACSSWVPHGQSCGDSISSRDAPLETQSSASATGWHPCSVPSQTCPVSGRAGQLCFRSFSLWWKEPPRLLKPLIKEGVVVLLARMLTSLLKKTMGKWLTSFL